ncbi:MAG: DUF4340 domain-containing protein [Planctomycetota bacterium]|nr:DUF4340 domain-containing protein [Planctomycetota bacterium]
MAITKVNMGLGFCAALLLVLRIAGGSDPLAKLENGDAFGAFRAEAILRLTLSDPGDAATQPLVLERGSSSSPWTVEARGDFPALAYPVEALLAAIDNLRLTDLVSEEASSHELFGVAAGEGIALSLQSPGGDAWQFVLGGMARGAGGTRIYLRSQSEARVFAATGLGAPSLDPRSWIDPSLVDFDVTLVTKIELQVAGASIILNRNDKGIWRDATRNKLASRIPVEGLIGEAAGLVLTDVSKLPFDAQAQGLGQDALRVILSGSPDAEASFEPIEITLGSYESAEVRALQGGADTVRQYIRSGDWARSGGAHWVGLLDGDSGNVFMTHVLEILGAIMSE